VVLDSLGALWSIGKNGFGQLGIKSRKTQTSLRPIALDYVVQVSAYGRQCCCVTDTRVAYMWGASIGLGLSSHAPRSQHEPTRVELPSVICCTVGPQWVIFQTTEHLWIQGSLHDEPSDTNLRPFPAPKRRVSHIRRAANGCVFLVYEDGSVVCKGDGLLPVTLVRSWAF